MTGLLYINDLWFDSGFFFFFSFSLLLGYCFMSRCISSAASSGNGVQFSLKKSDELSGMLLIYFWKIEQMGK